MREQRKTNINIQELINQPRMHKNKITIGKKVLTTEEINNFIDVIKNKQKPIIVCGPQTDKVLSEQIILLSKKLNIPIIADPLSQIRSTKQTGASIIDASDAILKSKEIRESLAPDMIIRFGAMPISKSYLFYLKENKNVPHYVIEADKDVREPT